MESPSQAMMWALSIQACKSQEDSLSSCLLFLSVCLSILPYAGNLKPDWGV